VDHVDDGVGCAGEFVGLIVVTKGVAAEIALSVGVVVVGRDSELISSGRRESGTVGAMILLQAALRDPQRPKMASHEPD
jgi:hypothetical protein